MCIIRYHICQILCPELENAVSAGLHSHQKRGLSQISYFAILIFGLKPKCNIASVLLRYKNHFVALTLVLDSHFLIEIGGDRKESNE